jgi:hypothetical protein
MNMATVNGRSVIDADAGQENQTERTLNERMSVLLLTAGTQHFRRLDAATLEVFRFVVESALHNGRPRLDRAAETELNLLFGRLEAARTCAATLQ